MAELGERRLARPERLRRLGSRESGALLLLLALFLASSIGCGSARGPESHETTGVGPGGENPSSEESKRHLLVCSPEGEIDVGMVAPGGRRGETFWLTNPADASVEVATLETSCFCLEVLLPCATIRPGERIGGRVVLDLGSESVARGTLAVRVRGLTASGQVAFGFEVRAELSGEEESAGGAGQPGTGLSMPEPPRAR